MAEAADEGDTKEGVEVYRAQGAKAILRKMNRLVVDEVEWVRTLTTEQKEAIEDGEKEG